MICFMNDYVLKHVRYWLALKLINLLCVYFIKNVNFNRKCLKSVLLKVNLIYFQNINEAWREECLRS